MCTCKLIYFDTAMIQSSKCQDSFYFDPAPVSQDVIEGEDLRLRCDVSSRRYIAFYWTLDGRTLANTSRRYQDSSDLRILGVNRTLDSGSFRCVAVNVSTGIAVRSAEARLNILCKWFRHLSIDRVTAAFVILMRAVQEYMPARKCFMFNH
jgi:hypothetical protein